MNSIDMKTRWHIKSSAAWRLCPEKLFHKDDSQKIMEKMKMKNYIQEKNVLIHSHANP